MESFRNTRNGAIQKTQLLNPCITTSPLDESAKETSARNFQEIVNTAVHHALIDHSSFLVNTLVNLISNVAGVKQGQQRARLLLGKPIGFNQQGKVVPPEFAIPKFPPPILQPQSSTGGP